jgi:teichuronic acid biosynthesis glycosyltransferase TuaC
MHMLRVLTLSTRFPDSSRPDLGNFIERQTLALAARPGVETMVVAPIGRPPFPLSLATRRRDLDDLPREEVWKGLQVHRPRFALLPYLPWDHPRAMARALPPLLRRIRRDFEFEIISAEFLWPEGPAAMSLASALGIPFSIKGRGDDVEVSARRPGSRGQILRAANAAGGLLAIGGGIRESMISLGIAGDRIAVHHSGVDRARFHPGNRASARAALKADGPLLINVGNLIPRKAQALAIDALTRIEGATLILVGGGPERDALAARAKALGLEERVRLLGHVPNALLPPLYNAADVTIHCPAREGLGNVRLESLACGTPLVTTPVGDAEILVDRPAAGRVVPPDPAAIAAAVRELLADPPERAEVSAAADRFSWERNARELEAHLRAVLRHARLTACSG